MNNNGLKDLLKKFLPFIIIFIVIVIIASITYYFFNNNRSGVPVSDLDRLVQNIPEEKKVSIQEAIEIIVPVNNPDIDVSQVKDTSIRSGSVTQDRQEDLAGYVGSFIVDIESLRQSYRVNYSHSNNENSPLNSGYPVYASCLETGNLIYGEFNCKESTVSTETDELLSKLPYETPFYSINSTRDSNDNTIVVVQIMINTNSSRTKSVFDDYRKQANNWIVSQGVELSDYVIQYRNLTNEIVD